MKMRYLRLATAFVLAAASASLAEPTQRFYCAVNDQNLTLVVEGVKKRGAGGEILEIEGRLQAKDKRMPKRFRNLNLREALAHSWFRKREFRLHFFVRIPTPYSDPLDLVLNTRFNTNKGVFQGEYVFDAFAENRRDAKLTGPITCKMD